MVFLSCYFSYYILFVTSILYCIIIAWHQPMQRSSAISPFYGYAPDWGINTAPHSVRDSYIPDYMQVNLLSNASI